MPKKGRPADKRKKRRLKKKQKEKDALAAVVALEPGAPQLVPPPAPARDMAAPLSPRKQTLMRHKKSDASIDEPLFLSEVKELRKHRRPAAAGHETLEQGVVRLELSAQNTEDKALLFKCPAARIVVYHEQLGDATASASSGTLLGHGEFEIFQLHNGDVTYLACGRSFVYPLLPRLKMLRIDKNHFILPLVNPQRYWKIHIDTDDVRVLSKLEVVLSKIVQYTNLSPAEPQNGTQAGAAVASDAPGAKTPFTPLFHDIPELPPSAPVSPSNLDLFARDNLQLLPLGPGVSNKTPNHAVPPAIASFQNAMSPTRRKPDATRRDLHHPRPVTHANPYRQNGLAFSDRRSDLSSMDSLLDEYEENISTTKSINFNMSRPQSRGVSVTSTAHPPAVQYQRGKMNLLPDRMSNLGSQYGTVEENMEEEEDEFPTTSLLQYNRTRQNTRSVRSRRSSPSELYTSVSNWMEPGIGVPKLAHSRSTHSLASRASASRPSTVNDTCREIYRSITLHNLSLIAAGAPESHRAKMASQPALSRAAASPYYSKLLDTEQVKRKNGERSVRKTPSQQDGLSSNDVYRLISSREARPKQGGLGRFFGW